MLAHQEDYAVSGAKTARMEQRTTQEAKELIELAACLLGIKPSEFTVSAAAKAARETLREFQGTVLTTQDHAAFMRALDATEPTAELRSLMSLHTQIGPPKWLISLFWRELELNRSIEVNTIERFFHAATPDSITSLKTQPRASKMTILLGLMFAVWMTPKSSLDITRWTLISLTQPRSQSLTARSYLVTRLSRQSTCQKLASKSSIRATALVSTLWTTRLDAALMSQTSLGLTSWFWTL
jgi:uncharacterized protein (DUF1778 family)